MLEDNESLPFHEDYFYLSVQYIFKTYVLPCNGIYYLSALTSILYSLLHLS